jgi:YVTN family beta-propeller protein
VGQTTYSPDGSTLYAALNGQNTVVALDPGTGTVEHTWNVGIAPRELAFAGGKLYVSDEGGRQAKPGDTTMDSYGTAVPANGYLGTSATGAVSVIDPANPSAPVGSIAVGLHPTAMHAVGNALFVANTNSDTVSVINTTANQVEQTIETKPWPESSVGYQPDGIAMTKDGHLLVTLGRANAVAVYQHPRHRRARPCHHDLQGTGNRPRDRPRHTQHHRIPDALHPSERPGHRQLHRDGLRPERLGQARRPRGQGRESGASPCPDAHR